MKEAHDQLFQLCSSTGKDFLNMQVPPTILAKQKKGHFPTPLTVGF